MDGLLTIGEFSSQCGLSPKMLRSYAAAGLLVPTAVDTSSGYRYYSTEQLPRARVIAGLRRADVPVEDIVRFFATHDLSLLDQWDRDIVRGSVARRQALSEARAAVEVAWSPSAEHPKGKGAPVNHDHDIAAGSASHIGGRETNEDAVFVSDNLFAIADGMGGLAEGGVASHLALEVLGNSFAVDDTVRGLLKGVHEANHAVWRRGAAAGEASAMGTTLAVVALCSDTGAVVAYVGDSRLYRLQNGRLTQLTEDHTVVADMISAGELTEEEAESHPYRFVLTRAIGVGPEVDIGYAGVTCVSGDRLLLCTDGLFKALSVRDLTTILTSKDEPQAVADALVAAAIGRECEDNATALVVDVR